MTLTVEGVNRGLPDQRIDIIVGVGEDPRPPATVQATLPTHGTWHVAPNVHPQVVFSEPIAETSFDNTTVTVVGDASGAHASSFTVDASLTVLTIDPGAEFAFDEEVTVSITTDVLTEQGRPLADLYSFTFRTRPETLTIQPHSGTLETDEIWASNYVHIIEGDVTIPADVTLTIAAGTVVKFNAPTGCNQWRYSMFVDGALSVLGLPTAKVVFTSSTDDAYGGDTNTDGFSRGASGDWGMIHYRQTDHGYILEHTVLRFGGARYLNCNGSVTDPYTLRLTDGADLALDDVTIEHSRGEGVHVGHSLSSLSVANTTIRSTGNNGHGINAQAALSVDVANSLITLLGSNGAGVNVGSATTVSVRDSAISWTGGAGISASSTTEIEILRNTIYAVGNVGVSAVASWSIDVSQNAIFGTESWAISVAGAGSATIADNVCTNAHDGLRVSTEGSTAVTANQVDGKNLPGTYGLQVMSPGKPTVTGCTFEEFSWGVYQNAGKVWDLAGCTIQHNKYPVYVGRSDLNFSGNTFTENTFAAVAVGGELTAEHTIWEGVPGHADWAYLVQSNVTVPDGKRLTILAGSVVKFEARPGCDLDRYALYVDGELDVQGAVDSPVVFTSSRDDTYGGDTNGDDNLTAPSRQDWYGIHLRNGLNSYSLSHVVVRYGGERRHRCSYGTVYDPYMLRVMNGASLTISDALLEELYGEGIRVEHEYSSFTMLDSVIRNTGSHAVNAPTSLDLVVAYCTIEEIGGSGITVGASSTVSVADSVFTNINGSGIAANATTTIDVLRNTITNIGASGVITGSSPEAFSSWTIDVSSNTISNTSGWCVSVAGLQRSLISNNACADVHDGILVTTEQGEATVRDNQIDGQNVPTSYGLRVDTPGAPMALNNTIKEFGWGVYQNAGEVWSLTDCTVRNCVYPVYVGRSSLDFSGNVFEDNTYAAIGVGGELSAIHTIWDGIPGYQGWAYLVQGDITVPYGRRLTIPAGTLVKFQPRSDGWRNSFFVDGELEILATPLLPVVFTSYQDDDYAGDTNGNGYSSGSPGDWGMIHFRSPEDYLLEHVVLRYGGVRRTNGTDPYMVYVTDGATLSVNDSSFENTWREAIRINDAFSALSIANSTIVNTGGSGHAINALSASTVAVDNCWIMRLGGGAYGVRLAGDTEATIQCSTFDYCSSGAIRVEATATADVHNCNLLLSNTMGVSNGGSVEVDGTDNYWGAPSGPGSIGPGEGAQVTANVLFDPWATEPFDCFVPNGPSITSEPSLAVIVGEPYEYDDDGHASAVGTGTLTWAKIIGPGEFLIDSETGEMTWMAGPVGPHVVVIEAADEVGYDRQIFQIVVSEEDEMGPRVVSFESVATDTGPTTWDAELTVAFTENVQVSAVDVAILDASNSVVSVESLEYAPASYTLHIVARDLVTDETYSAVLADTITDDSGNLLDGEFDGHSFPSGDGVPGGEFRALFGSSATVFGDVDGDNDVDLNDFAIFVDCLKGTAECTPEYMGATDFSNDGAVDLLDFALFQAAFGVNR